MATVGFIWLNHWQADCMSCRESGINFGLYTLAVNHVSTFTWITQLSYAYNVTATDRWTSTCLYMYISCFIFIIFYFVLFIFNNFICKLLLLLLVSRTHIVSGLLALVLLLNKNNLHTRNPALEVEPYFVKNSVSQSVGIVRLKFI